MRYIFLVLLFMLSIFQSALADEKKCINISGSYYSIAYLEKWSSFDSNRYLLSTMFPDLSEVSTAVFPYRNNYFLNSKIGGVESNRTGNWTKIDQSNYSLIFTNNYSSQSDGSLAVDIRKSKHYECRGEVIHISYPIVGGQEGSLGMYSEGDVALDSDGNIVIVFKRWFRKTFSAVKERYSEIKLYYKKIPD